MKSKHFISVAIAFQAMVLVGMVVTSALPMWTGQEIKVKTVPVDPRDLFRGNYARLNYEFSRVSKSQIVHAEKIRQGEVVYVSLQPGKNGLYEFHSASLTKPETGIFLRGRIEKNWSQQMRINYGIEAYFAPKDEALRLEKELRQGGIATLKVAGNGRSRIASILSSP